MKISERTNTPDSARPLEGPLIAKLGSGCENNLFFWYLFFIQTGLNNGR
jgi:hypothetical protein